MWGIYDELIDLVPPDAVVDDCLVGLHWTLVRVGAGVGTAMTVPDGAHDLRLAALAGPSAPLAPVLLRHGTHMLAGTVVIDPGAVWRVAQEGGILQIFESGGQMVTLTAAKAGVNRAIVRRTVG